MVKRMTAFPALTLLLLLGCWSCGIDPGEIEGTVTFREAGVEGVAVEVYLEEKRSEAGTPFMSVQTEREGLFLMSLPPGQYYLWAKEEAPAFGPRKIAEHPDNPVRVASGARLELKPLELRPAGSSGEASIPPGAGIEGSVLFGGTPVEAATVMVYGEERGRLMGPGYVAVVNSDAGGRFQADLAPGRYMVAVRKRQDGMAAGFLREGDLSADYEGNPVEVRPDEYTGLGAVVLHEVSEKRLETEALGRFQASTTTRLAGRVVDGEGKPLAGKYVMIYRDQAMIGRPDFLTASGEEGEFVFNLPAGGTYYVGARDRFGGPRQPGEMVGRLAGSADSAVELADGTVMGDLTIHMQEMW